MHPLSRFTRPTAAALLVPLLALASGCFLFKKSDAERAREERAQIDEQVKKSLKLVPYRGIKTVVRAKDSPDPPKEFGHLVEAANATVAPDANVATYVQFAVALYRARADLNKHDEDKYPTLWATLTHIAPVRGYDSGLEHLFLAITLDGLALADRSGHLPVRDFVFYELSRAQVSLDWPWIARACSRLERGIAFSNANYHYAAEEELNGFLDEWQKAPADDLATLAALMRTSPTYVKEAGAATGHFVRAWNRMGLGRDEAADADIEAGLASLEKIGVDNELTQWSWALLHYRRGRYADSARYLEKLAHSPYIDETAKTEILAAAAGLKKEKDVPVLSRARAFTLVGSALIARAGGMENIFVFLAGPETGKKIYAKVAWIDRLRKNVVDADGSKIEDTAKGIADKGKKGFDLIKAKLGGPPPEKDGDPKDEAKKDEKK